MNAKIKHAITHLVNNCPSNRERVLGRVLLSLRISETVNGYSPFYLMFGREHSLQQTPTHTTTGEPTLQWFEGLKRARELARENIIHSRGYNKKHLSRTSGQTFKVGDRVLLKANPQRLPFTAHYDPGYRVKAVNGPAITIENSKSNASLIGLI